MALKGPSTYACQCPLIGHDQTCRGPALTAEFDPSRTLGLISVGVRCVQFLTHRRRKMVGFNGQVHGRPTSPAIDHGLHAVHLASSDLFGTVSERVLA
jgi:hypothetical protein